MYQACFLLAFTCVFYEFVFETTDLPSFISGSTIGVLDPHYKYFTYEMEDTIMATSSYSWNLIKDRDEIAQLQDQFAPLKKEFFNVTQAVFDSGHFNGTLFRFPLRCKTNKNFELGNIYTVDKVYNLFDSLRADGDLLLLFMKNLCEILIYDSKVAGKEEPIFSVKIDETTNSKMIEARSEFIRSILSGSAINPIHSSYIIECQSREYRGNATNKNSKWLLQQYFDCKENAKKAKKDLKNKKNLPWVGTAICISDIESENITCDSGRIFCCLPLPSDTRKVTGLKFHINGYFSVDQNRRHIKWPTTEQKRSHITDPELLWNIYLVNEILPKALLYQFFTTVQIFQEHNKNIQLIYDMLPVANDVLQPWKELVDSFYKLFVCKKICYTPTKGGKWINIEAGVFDNLFNGACDNLIRQILEYDGINIVSVPNHLLQTFLKLKSGHVKCVSAKLARSSCIRQQQKLTREDKLNLLPYLASDCMYEDLVGLEFIPCADGVMRAFQSKQEVNQTVIYLVDDSHPAAGIPSVASIIVNISSLSCGASVLKQIAECGKRLILLRSILFHTS